MPDSLPQSYIAFMRDELRRSPRTVETYREDYKLFEAYFGGLDAGLSWHTVDTDVVRDWMMAMTEAGISPRTVNRRLTALRSLYRWARARGLVESDPAAAVKNMRHAKPLPQFLRESEMDELLDGPHWGADFTATLSRTIVLAFYTLGLRVSELAGMNDADVDFARGSVSVTGKGNKQRQVPFGPELREALAAYREQRDAEVERHSPAFFVGVRGKRLCTEYVRRMVKRRLAEVSTLQKRTPHVLRHTFATALLNHNANIEDVRLLLGHESAATTEIYTHTTFEQLKRIYAEAHPRARDTQTPST